VHINLVLGIYKVYERMAENIKTEQAAGARGLWFEASPGKYLKRPYPEK
jgi:hypothetical protein